MNNMSSDCSEGKEFHHMYGIELILQLSPEITSSSGKQGNIRKYASISTAYASHCSMETGELEVFR